MKNLIEIFSKTLTFFLSLRKNDLQVKSAWDGLFSFLAIFMFSLVSLVKSVSTFGRLYLGSPNQPGDESFQIK